MLPKSARDREFGQVLVELWRSVLTFEKFFGYGQARVFQESLQLLREEMFGLPFLRGYSEGGWWSESLYLTRFIRKTGELKNVTTKTLTFCRPHALNARHSRPGSWRPLHLRFKIFLGKNKAMNIWHYSPRNYHIPSKGSWADEFPFPLMRYVSSLEGINIRGVGDIRRCFFQRIILEITKYPNNMKSDTFLCLLFSKDLSCRPMV